LPAPFGRSFAAYSFAVLLAAATCRADELTPSGGPDSAQTTGSMEAAEVPGKISFEEAAEELAAVYPIQASEFLQVAQNSYNWRGPADASIRCDIGFTPSAVVIKGEFRDDHPFHQTMISPAMPGWWRITYGADGIEFVLDDPTSASQRVQFALNFGSQGLNPRVYRIASPLVPGTGPIPTAALEVFKDPNDSPAAPNWHFQVAVPFSALADPRFFARPMHITARVHDVDGDMSTYLRIEQTIEKR
jgi:hypothetical protein